MAHKRICIIGGGLAGLTLAHFLQKKKKECRIFEAEAQVGGLCRSKQVKGFIFDHSGHLLHFTHKDTFSFVKGLLGNNLAAHQRNACVYAGGGFVRYPFQANLYGLPRDIAQECLFEFIKARCRPSVDAQRKIAFEEWVMRTFGRGIARHFMLPYNRKFWAVPVSSLTTEWVDGFIPVPSLKEVIEGSLALSDRKYGYNARFWYPCRGGIQALADALAGRVKGIRTNSKVVEVDLRRKRVRLQDGGWERYDLLVSTMPLPEWEKVAVVPAAVKTSLRQLKWTAIRTINYGVKSSEEERRHWTYFPQEEIPFFRCGFAHRFSRESAPRGMHSLYVEISRLGRSTRPKKWPTDESVYSWLRATGSIGPKDKVVVRDSNEFPYGYVIYDRCRTTAVNRIKGFLSRHGVLCAGRYGSWEYLSMEGTMRQARSLALSL